MKKIKCSAIIFLIMLIISIPSLAIYISYSLGEKAISYSLKIEQTIVAKAANAPKISNGMIPVAWNENTCKWKVVDTQNTNNEWYNYFSSKWANIMMSDGTTYIAESISTDSDSNGIDDVTGKQIASINDEISGEQLGSMFVWIPRFEYNLDSSNNKITIKYIAENDTATTGYTLHPAFTDGTDSSFENGEWDKEISGFWFAKFEASKRSSDSAIQILPNKTGYNNISIANSYSNSKAATFDLQNATDIANINSHLIKNSEWGAVAYLSWSSYGTNANEITINNYFNRTNTPNAKTGLAGATPDAAETASMSSVYTYETPDGQKASTTWNIYGVYDMKGGLTEYSAGVINGKTLNSTDDGTKYITKYTTTPQKIGDAISETSGWNGKKAANVSTTAPYTMRGEPGTSAGLAGIFAYNSSDGVASKFRGFRVSLIVE